MGATNRGVFRQPTSPDRRSIALLQDERCRDTKTNRLLPWHRVRPRRRRARCRQTPPCLVRPNRAGLRQSRRSTRMPVERPGTPEHHSCGDYGGRTEGVSHDLVAGALGGHERVSWLTSPCSTAHTDCPNSSRVNGRSPNATRALCACMMRLTPSSASPSW